MFKLRVEYGGFTGVATAHVLTAHHHFISDDGPKMKSRQKTPNITFSFVPFPKRRNPNKK